MPREKSPAFTQLQRAPIKRVCAVLRLSSSAPWEEPGYCYGHPCSEQHQRSGAGIVCGQQLWGATEAKFQGSVRKFSGHIHQRHNYHHSHHGLAGLRKNSRHGSTEGCATRGCTQGPPGSSQPPTKTTPWWLCFGRHQASSANASLGTAICRMMASSNTV